jgi:hypothetical protein
VAAFCLEYVNYLSMVEEDRVAYLKLLSLFIIPKNSEDLRRSLERDDRLEEVGPRS